MTEFLLGDGDTPLPIAFDILGFVSCIWLLTYGVVLLKRRIQHVPSPPDWRVSILNGGCWAVYGWVVAWQHGLLSIPAFAAALSCAMSAGYLRYADNATDRQTAVNGLWASVALAATTATATIYPRASAADRRRTLLANGWTYTTLANQEHWYPPGRHPQTSLDFITPAMNLDSAWSTFHHQTNRT